MKISLELIAQEMAGMIPEARVTISPGESSSEMTLFNFMLLGTEALSKGILVLVGPNKIFEPDGDLLREIRDTGASLCFVGTPPCAVTEGQTPYIRCVYHDKTAPDNTLYSKVIKSLRLIFLKYENWQQAGCMLAIVSFMIK